ncbi:hypothetical protein [Roseibium sp. RKSG952]|uniref:hypothetical protein n=1 Tax=Roseibium sp. RKSG952 TaxID=2529384 RepID=UPI0012BC77F9|nr:hypothetical protein [Roseibium sp. RKSG952]MTH96251.1 hypothetical protein [Roseibium sp. RKSG952]
MARFPFFKNNVRALGKILAQASIDDVFAEHFASSPNKILKDAGLPEQTTSLFNIVIAKNDLAKRKVILPYKLNTKKLSELDHEYTTRVGEILTTN